MKNSKFLTSIIALATIAAVALLWLKILDSIDPEVDENDGEGDEEIDPDLPSAQPGDLLLFNRAKGLNRLITWFTKSRFYHVGIYIGDNHVVEARPRGVVSRDLMGKDGDKRFEIIPAKNVGGNEVGLQAASWAKAQIGDGYDPFNVAAIVLDRYFTCCAFNASLTNNWSCGEFVATAFLEAGKELFPDREVATVVPADFEKFLP